METTNIDNFFEKFYYKEEQRNGAVAGRGGGAREGWFPDERDNTVWADRDGLVQKWS